MIKFHTTAMKYSPAAGTHASDTAQHLDIKLKPGYVEARF
jgi:hypothetical protein